MNDAEGRKMETTARVCLELAINLVQSGVDFGLPELRKYLHTPNLVTYCTAKLKEAGIDVNSYFIDSSGDLLYNMILALIELDGHDENDLPLQLQRICTHLKLYEFSTRDFQLFIIKPSKGYLSQCLVPPNPATQDDPNAPLALNTRVLRSLIMAVVVLMFGKKKDVIPEAALEAGELIKIDTDEKWRNLDSTIADLADQVAHDSSISGPARLAAMRDASMAHRCIEGEPPSKKSRN